MKKHSLFPMLRRFLCILLLVLLVGSVFTPAAAAAQKYRAGDIDGDKKITAADARIALRIAVDLAIAADEIRSYADANGDSRVDAEDARLLLRVAVGLENTKSLAVFDSNGPFRGTDIPYWGKTEMDTLELVAGQNYKIKQDYVKRKGTQYSWTSSNPAVATVTTGGTIKTASKGFTCVYLTVGANRYYYYVNVISSLQKKIFSLQNKYPSGYYWNAHTKSKKYPAVSEIPCDDHASGGYKYCIGQCAGFASLLSDEVFGKDAPEYEIKDKNKIKIGDYLRCLPSHSVFVIDRVNKGEICDYDMYDDKNITAWDTYITVAECNWDWHCGINWGRQIALSNVNLDFNNEWFVSYTRYK